MKTNGLHASTSGSKKVIAVSIILAIVLAIISAIGVFAAPTQIGVFAAPTQKSTFGEQISQLNFARAWFNSARLNAANFVHTSDPAKAQQYLSQYAFALRQADAVVSGHGTSGDLAKWLRVMHGLRQKLIGIGFSANVNNGSNTAGAGVPVTGGTSSSSSSSSSSAGAATPTATPTTSSSSSSSSSSPTPTTSSSSSSSSSSSATSTATPSTSSSSATAAVPVTGNSAANNSAAQHSALAKVWGKQFRDLEAARTWFNNFRSNPHNFAHPADPAKTQQWLSQYAFALRQADMIVQTRGTTKNQSNASTPNSTSVNQTTPAQQDLARWLHLMRELREKLTGDANDPLGLND